MPAAHARRRRLATAALTLAAIAVLWPPARADQPGRSPYAGNPAAARQGGSAPAALGAATPRSARAAARFPIIGTGTPWQRPPEWRAARLTAPGAAPGKGPATPAPGKVAVAHAPLAKVAPQPAPAAMAAQPRVVAAATPKAGQARPLHSDRAATAAPSRRAPEQARGSHAPAARPTPIPAGQGFGADAGQDLPARGPARASPGVEKEETTAR